MNQRYSRHPQPPRSRDDGYYRGYSSPVAIVETHVTKPEDRFVVNGATYDRSILLKLRSTFPKMYVNSDSKAIANAAVSDTVMRYDPQTHHNLRTTPDLIFVDHRMQPILVPNNYDGELPEMVHLVTKHSLKKALVTT